MRKITGKCSRGIALATLAFLSFSASPLIAGPYAPKAETEGITAIHMSSTDFVGWATGVYEYVPGTDVAVTWQTTDKAE